MKFLGMNLNFLSEEGNESTMRVSFFLVTIFSCLILLCLGAYIVVFAIKGQEIQQWVGMATFMAGVTSLVGFSGYNKWKQRQIESDEITKTDKKDLG